MAMTAADLLIKRLIDWGVDRPPGRLPQRRWRLHHKDVLKEKVREVV
jgi:hypothetical protein